MDDGSLRSGARHPWGGAYLNAEWGASTARGNIVYLFVYTWDKNGKRHFPTLNGLKPIKSKQCKSEFTLREIRKGLRDSL